MKTPGRCCWAAPARSSTGSWCRSSVRWSLGLLEALHVQHEHDSPAHAHLHRLYQGGPFAEEGEHLHRHELRARVTFGSDHREHLVDLAALHAGEDGGAAAVQEAARAADLRRRV